MATKTRSVYVRVEPQVKEEAEEVLGALGLPLSSAINLFLRQIAIRQGLPFPVALPHKHRVEIGLMSAAEKQEALEEGYRSYLCGEGRPADDVFASIEKE
ncbi:MAG: type II toxin-antitoxin system RelB/DinJ family antitoxin [Selenomonadaceae bacterium]|nr:type II toxin-antitoxin system RelB/DinJ family antitoxin [Selenomonadaceae bacterium]